LFRIGSAASLKLSEAIRSVSDLVLAPRTKQLFVFLLFFILQLLRLCLSLLLSFLQAPIPLQQDQKTFSVGPRSLRIKELWFPGTGCCPGSNPFLTRDTIESPAKILFELHSNLSESRRFQSVNMVEVQPLRWLAAALEKSIP
jgi:hypothetical protein